MIVNPNIAQWVFGVIIFWHNSRNLGNNGRINSDNNVDNESNNECNNTWELVNVTNVIIMKIVIRI